MPKTLIEITNAQVCVNGTHVLHDFNWTMHDSQNWAIVGNNGAGKTTFMKLIFGELIPMHGGEVSWFGVRGLRPLAEIREQIGFVSAEFQERYEPNILSWQVVASGLFQSIGLYGPVGAEQKTEALQWMDFLGIAHLSGNNFHQLSYGEARRVLLARALVNQPRLLILDEPCSGLDIPTRELFLDTLSRLSRSETRIVYVTHHIDEIMPLISHVLYIKDGKVFLQGEKESMLESESISRALGCQVTVQKNSGRFWITDSQRPAKGH
ncbi:MAG: ATP-binding cassette domain-containing protein [Candidatus Nitrohelix vancouverensis]|uniref:ATP-binding cassette domain-containing protein n=1 Tax=Candidatus Nitrohelix vancouverensis TaxID=2705534 RepID=A0A7T0C4R7_9BACT|nr:MAG: ATP-binding cassette domain-containing protein [Candidatus Nitrohelix vancouverensis]